MVLVKRNLHPSARQLRQFAGVCAAVFALLAAGVHWRGRLFGLEVPADQTTQVVYILLAGGALTIGAGVVYPKGLRPLFVGLSVATTPIGFVLSYVLLIATYFLVFTPIGLAMRMFGWDPMRKRRDASAASYWVRRGPRPPPSRYFHQY